MGVNKDLGLPFGDGMQKIAICFDIDGTLVNGDEELHSTIALLRVLGLQKWKNVKIVVWSGGGKQYAETIGHRLNIDDIVWKYMGKLQHNDLRELGYTIIAIDDVQDTRLGDVNLIVRNK